MAPISTHAIIQDVLPYTCSTASPRTITGAICDNSTLNDGERLSNFSSSTVLLEARRVRPGRTFSCLSVIFARTLVLKPHQPCVRRASGELNPTAPRGLRFEVSVN